MDLHRADTVPDWELIPAEEWSNWQKIAAKTGGVVTPGNLLTVAGKAIALAGLREYSRGNHKKGFALVATGAMTDFFDGRTAERTKTKSPLGEKFDAVTDKALAAVALRVLTEREVVPKSVAATIGVQNAASAGFSIYSYLKHDKIQPGAEGKTTATTQWVTNALYAGAELLEGRKGERLARVAAHASLAFSSYVGTTTAINYGKHAYRITHRGNEVPQADSE